MADTTATSRRRYAGFLDLPAEIRNIIYDLAAHSHLSWFFCDRFHPIARVCRQLRKEYIPRHYHITSPRIDMPDPSEPSCWKINDCEAPSAAQLSRSFLKWLRVFGESRAPFFRRFEIVADRIALTVDLATVAMAEIRLRWGETSKRVFKGVTQLEVNLRVLLEQAVLKAPDGTLYMTKSSLAKLIDKIAEYDQCIRREISD